MKLYTGKKLENILDNARKDLNVEKNNLHYVIIEERKRLFSTKLIVECYTSNDIAKGIEEYIKDIVTSLNIEVKTISTKYSKREMSVSLTTSDDSMMIGRDGRNLQALTELVKSYLSTKFRRRFSVIVNINNYKDRKYETLKRTAIIVANEVVKTKIDATLDQMSNDERKIVHKALQYNKDIETKSEGIGKYRRLVIKYKRK